MTDVVITCPMDLWDEWLGEGVLPGEPCPEGTEFHFYLSYGKPAVAPGERVYVVAHGRLRGWAPLVRIEATWRSWALVRHGGAVACTIPQAVRGFRGFKYRWWKREDEVAFPEWRTAGVRATPEREPAR